jgi:C-22 sterol desaturase
MPNALWTDFATNQSERRIFAKYDLRSPAGQDATSLSWTTTTMSSMFRVLSASVSMPSPTSLVQLSNIQFPSLLSSTSKVATWTYTTLAIVFALLALEQSVYRYKKKHLPGDSWTIPIIGKFADSMNPTMEGYMKQWNAGALSALSVFNMSVSSASDLIWKSEIRLLLSRFIVMASSTQYSRKILNSPTHAEPCLVYSAKQVLRPENW